MTEQEVLTLLDDENTRKKAFNWIVNEYSERLYWHARRMVNDHEDANDILQNSLLRVWKNLAGFRGDSKIFTWLYRITTNEALSFLSNRKRQLSHNSSSLDDFSNQLEADSWFEGTEAEKKLLFAIGSLPVKQKQVFLLRYYDEMKYEEMSEILGTSEGGLKASYHHAVKKIEKFLKQD